MCSEKIPKVLKNDFKVLVKFFRKCQQFSIGTFLMTKCPRTKRFRLKTAAKLLHLIERCDWYLRQNCKIKSPLYFDREFKKIAHTNFWSLFVTQNCNFSFNIFSSYSVKEKDVTSQKYAVMLLKKNEIHTVHPFVKKILRQK